MSNNTNNSHDTEDRLSPTDISENAGRPVLVRDKGEAGLVSTLKGEHVGAWASGYDPLGNPQIAVSMDGYSILWTGNNNTYSGAITYYNDDGSREYSMPIHKGELRNPSDIETKAQKDFSVAMDAAYKSKATFKPGYDEESGKALPASGGLLTHLAKELGDEQREAFADIKAGATIEMGVPFEPATPN